MDTEGRLYLPTSAPEPAELQRQMLLAKDIIGINSLSYRGNLRDVEGTWSDTSLGLREEHGGRILLCNWNEVSSLLTASSPSDITAMFLDFSQDT